MAQANTANFATHVRIDTALASMSTEAAIINQGESHTAHKESISSYS